LSDCRTKRALIPGSPSFSNAHCHCRSDSRYLSSRDSWLGRAIVSVALALWAIFIGPPLAAQDRFRNRLPEDEIVYFVLPDRFENGDSTNDTGGLKGDRLKTGFDPAHKGFYHGGDLKGLTSRLDYLQALGITAIWLGPIFKNKPVQGPKDQESAGYHGYWITDFTAVDPHFGTNEEFKAFVDAAHLKGIKVYMDIITNHTADVIRYRECPNNDCVYRPRGQYPYSTAGAVGGKRINPGFLGDHMQTEANFKNLKRADFAYRSYVPAAEAKIKVPQWLNDPIWYHNRGNSSFRGESITHGDFAGLDDLMTENPRVVAGFIEIYAAWIDRFGVDGFRIDTAKHVNPEFWQAFVPAMLARARARGIPNFHIFGEVFTEELDVALLARATKVDKLPSVLDFAFRVAALQTVAGESGTEVFVRLFNADALYEDGSRTSRQLPTFISNHDVGRFSQFVKRAFPQASDEEVLKRVMLAHAMMFTMRGVPVIYSGDEQGFVSDGGDQDAREDMFASSVAIYNDNRLIGTSASTADANFDRQHPLFQGFADLAKLRGAHSALRTGGQVVRHFGETPGLFAISRLNNGSSEEILIVFNTSKQPQEAIIEVDYDERGFSSLHGNCEAKVAAPGSYRVRVPGLEFVICKAVDAS
jgi:neopullulanase